jgi:hypothetical protein
MSIPTLRRSWFLPWRSATAGWLATALALLVGVPLFLCMPPWNDVTLHDMAARSILRGGVHYRDVFDTNLPGIDWAMAAVRLLFGWSSESLRAVDLLVIGAEVALLLLWVRRAGGSSVSLAWLAAAVALFYPFCSEFNHMQRDPWLLLPALLAARLRLLRVTSPIDRPTPPARWCAGAAGEGLVWGLAVWVKPHVIVPAVAVWAMSALVLAKREPVRRILLDLAGLLAGGLIAGALGSAWLIATGAWPYFLDVFLNWNPSYLSDLWDDTLTRFLRTFYCFRPWSILHIPAIVLAILALAEAHVWSRRSAGARLFARAPWLYAPAPSEAVAMSRALLAVFYLGWFAQAVFLQKGFDYVQVPLLFLGMAVVAAQSWAFGCVYLVWFAAVGLVLNWPAIAPAKSELEPSLKEVSGYCGALSDWELLRLWPRCWREGGTPELRDRLGHYTDVFCGTNWEELADVAQFLKSVHPPLGPGDLNCWHDSTHPLYLMLDLDPATRYMHYGTAFGIRKKAGAIAAEVAASRQRYVVSDLLRMTWRLDEAYAPGAQGDPHLLPTWMPLSQRSVFPWNQPIVFRSGRYLVHKVERPLGAIDLPDWFKLDELGPGEVR